MKDNRLRILALLIPESLSVELPSSASQLNSVTLEWVIGDEHGNPKHLSTMVPVESFAAFVRDLTPGWLEEQL